MSISPSKCDSIMKTYSYRTATPTPRNFNVLFLVVDPDLITLIVTDLYMRIHP